MNPLESTIAICGHAKHGKSTLAGRLLFEMGGITKEQLEKNWSFVKVNVPNYEGHKKDFNKYNYVFLQGRSATFSKESGGPDDQSRTVFPSRGSASIGKQRITIIDQPGYSRFINNIIYGIYLASFGILVVDVNDGIQKGTIQMAELLSFFEIPIIAICITKMDIVDYSADIFKEILQKIETEITKPYLSYSPPIIPVSAISDGRLDNRLSWYKDKKLIDVIQEIDAEDERASSKPLRCVLKEVYSPPGISTVLVGILESGKLMQNTTYILEPASSVNQNDILIKPRSIQLARGVNEAQKENINELSARAIVALSVPELTVSAAKALLKNGGVLGRIEDRPSVAKRLKAEVVFFKPGEVYTGKKFYLQANTSTSDAVVTSLGKTPSSKDDIRRTYGEKLELTLELETPICVEANLEFGKLCLFTLLEHNEVIACGRCVEMEKL